MSINDSESPKTHTPSPEGQTAGNIRFLPIGDLQTTYASLRPGAVHQLPNDTSELPIRVVPTDDGSYEVIDGFKRLAAWREQGHGHIPVVLERPSRSEQHKRLLLLANSPQRTLTALDEARVVCSLLTEERLTHNSIARLLQRKPQWVARRVDIGTRLTSTAEDKLAHGTIGPSLAHALCALPKKDQDAVLGSIDNHALKHREALVLVSTYRMADETDRRELLRAPLGLVRAEPT
ncbi:MAG: ParB N-terminal domain-containing protein, partial [bacterium]|nr:ParB N-terminal domain-containing protein [bacterium]